MQVEELFSAGIFPTNAVGDPGTQGVVTGIHGMGVRTPIAAAVAAATVGFAGDEHMPKGSTLVMGAKSMIVAVGAEVITPFVGSTINEPGAAPKLH